MFGYSVFGRWFSEPLSPFTFPSAEQGRAYCASSPALGSVWGVSAACGSLFANFSCGNLIAFEFTFP